MKRDSGKYSSRRGEGFGIAFLREHLNDPDGPCISWPLSCNNYGYAICGYNGKRWKVGRLLCEMLYGPAPTPKHHAAHKCGRGQFGCVHPKHVRWATPKENMQESVRLGAVHKPGERPKFILTEAQVAQIMALKGKKTQLEIGLMFGVKGKQIGRIHRGECWKGGKRARAGFKPGDPRNPSTMRRLAAMREAS